MVQYMLLIWRGYWKHAGPDHGRYPFFPTAKKAFGWAADEEFVSPSTLDLPLNIPVRFKLEGGGHRCRAGRNHYMVVEVPWPTGLKQDSVVGVPSTEVED